jgi:hypothetical protein
MLYLLRQLCETVLRDHTGKDKPKHNDIKSLVVKRQPIDRTLLDIDAFGAGRRDRKRRGFYALTIGIKIFFEPN